MLMRGSEARRTATRNQRLFWAEQMLDFKQKVIDSTVVGIHLFF